MHCPVHDGAPAGATFALVLSEGAE